MRFDDLQWTELPESLRANLEFDAATEILRALTADGAEDVEDASLRRPLN